MEPPRLYTLPLFPLNSVQFPQFPLQLHIFEERYKAMINACIDNNAPFGVVLIREGNEVGEPATPHRVGCVARILEVERLRDGRMNLLAVCEERFRVLETMEADQPYLIGRVEEWEDRDVETDDLSELIADVSGLFSNYLALLAAHAHLPMPDVDLPDDPQTLAFCVASVAMLPLSVKQHLLEMTDTRARLQEELRLLREQIAELKTERPDTTKPDASAESEERVAVLIARPLNTNAPRWQRVIDEMKN